MYNYTFRIRHSLSVFAVCILKSFFKFVNPLFSNFYTCRPMFCVFFVTVLLARCDFQLTNISHSSTMVHRHWERDTLVLLLFFAVQTKPLCIILHTLHNNINNKNQNQIKPFWTVCMLHWHRITFVVHCYSAMLYVSIGFYFRRYWRLFGVLVSFHACAPVYC